MAKLDSETWAFQNFEEDGLDLPQTKCLRVVVDTRLTNRGSNNKLSTKMFCLIALSRVIMRDGLIWLCHVLEKRDIRLSNITLFDYPTRAKQKDSCLHAG